MESKELAIRLARALDAKKGYNISILHVESCRRMQMQLKRRVKKSTI